MPARAMIAGRLTASPRLTINCHFTESPTCAYNGREKLTLYRFSPCLSLKGEEDVSKEYALARVAAGAGDAGRGGAGLRCRRRRWWHQRRHRRVRRGRRDRA